MMMKKMKLEAVASLELAPFEVVRPTKLALVATCKLGIDLLVRPRFLPSCCLCGSEIEMDIPFCLSKKRVQIPLSVSRSHVRCFNLCVFDIAHRSPPGARGVQIYLVSHLLACKEK